MLIGLLSDAHGNLAALRQGFEILRDGGATAFFFLGDAVGYIPDGRTVGFLRENAIQSVCGNHDRLVSATPVDAERERIYQHARTWATMSELDREHLLSWPDRRNLSFGAVTCLLVHGSPADPCNGYVYPDTDLGAFSDVAADFIFMGHTHRPFIREANGNVFVNVGSCGLPRGDDTRAAVCLFDPATRHVEIVRYAIGAACRHVLSTFELAPSVKSALSRCIIEDAEVSP